MRIDTTGLPAVVYFDDTVEPEDFIVWFEENKTTIDDLLLKNGAVLFRGIPIYANDDFDYVISGIGIKPINYEDGTSPRKKLGPGIYTSTEFDPTQKISMHNELSYSAKWPSKLFFCCLIPAASGGETPLANSREVLANIDQELVSTIEKKKIKYIRNLNGGKGFGPSWQTTFETNDRAVVEKICAERGIQFEWKKDNGIRLVQVNDGIISHPVTGEKVWFNQIDQFHPAHFDDEVFETLMGMYKNETDFPMYVTFGDDTKIERAAITQVCETLDRMSIKNKWESGDLLMIDNILTSHGRMPYIGERKVLVSMC